MDVPPDIGLLPQPKSKPNPLRFLPPACFHRAAAPTKAPGSSECLGTQRSTGARRLAPPGPALPGHRGMETAHPRPPADPPGSGWGRRDLLKDRLESHATGPTFVALFYQTLALLRSVKAHAPGLSSNVNSTEEWEKLMRSEPLPRRNTCNYYFGWVSKSNEAGGVTPCLRRLHFII